ncbi:HAD family hydrolase [Aerococcus urinae]|uniref:HAD family hydrolase n=1 Tax=Aerococcus urinae TaxID=1376 RepID=A0A7T2RR33_9LACT|nr:HAD family hydrolase [Aerococcus urinae]MCY3032110.1 HAD family hydrolase [Aerococcus urinae]MCY3037616.1 HAD family hydrolase [Aerococcus urinae]MCY3044156.1 HAD family hydrolase [Aerococcus urinae]MCY3045718.1 HAD family hydrolase [Aerococcus urinae]MCY3049336.1 HAD family hydrolase [Aerococcus urinae]
MIQAVGWDLDDTLYDRNLPYLAVYQYMEENVIETGIGFETFNYFYQMNSDIEFRRYTDGQASVDQYRNNRVLMTYAQFGFTIKKQDAILFNQKYEEAKEDIVLRPGAKDCLDLLQKAGLKQFLLTNGPAQQAHKVDLLGLEDYFDDKNIFISSQMGAAKPASEIFQKVEEALELNSATTLYIGDNYEADMKGASNAGWQGLFLNVHDKSVEDVSDKIIICKDMDDIYKSLISKLEEKK